MDKSAKNPETKERNPWLVRGLGPSAWRVVAVVVLLLSGCAAYFLGLGYQLQGSPTNGLTIQEQYLDIGKVWENKEHHVRLPVENITNEDLEILGFASSCSCVRI